MTKFRHLHPKEVALLCGMCPDHIPDSHTTHLRLSLAGVGQMASPLHAAWVGGHLVESLQSLGGDEMRIQKHQAVFKIVERLFQTRDALIPHAPKTRYMELFEKAVHEALVCKQTSDVDKGDCSSQELLEAVIQVEQQMNAPLSIHSADDDENEFSDDAIRDAFVQSQSENIDASHAAVTQDPYWECPYDDCFICHPGLTIAVEPHEQNTQGTQHEVQSKAFVEVSATIPFEISEETIEIPAT